MQLQEFRELLLQKYGRPVKAWYELPEALMDTSGLGNGNFRSGSGGMGGIQPLAGFSASFFLPPMWRKSFSESVPTSFEFLKMVDGNDLDDLLTDSRSAHARKSQHFSFRNGASKLSKQKMADGNFWIYILNAGIYFQL